MELCCAHFASRARRESSPHPARCPENPPSIARVPANGRSQTSRHPRQLLLRCPTSCIPAVVSKPFLIATWIKQEDSAKSAEQASLWRRARMGVRTPPGIPRRFLLQMVQYLPDDRWIFKAGDDVHGMSSQLIHRIFICVVQRLAHDLLQRRLPVPRPEIPDRPAISQDSGVFWRSYFIQFQWVHPE